MIGAWMALMITASSLVVSASPAADMSSVSADPQQEQTEPEEEEEAPDIPVTDQPGEAEMPVPTALPEPETVEEAFEEGKDNTENTDSDELIEPEKRTGSCFKRRRKYSSDRDTGADRGSGIYCIHGRKRGNPYRRK